MITTYKYRDISWVDLESPTPDEIKTVIDSYKINESVAQELFAPTLKPKVDLFHDYIYLVLHFAAIRHSHTGDMNQEIDFIIGKKFIITTHYDTIDPLHQFSKIFEVNSILDRSEMGEHAGYIFFHMIKHLYKGMLNELDVIKDKLSFIQNHTFSGNEREMVAEIAKVNRNLIDLKRSLRPHGETLKSMEIAGLKFFGSEFDYHLKAVGNDFYKVESELSSHSELLAELRDTNDSLLSTKQNETMKILAVIAFITLPLSVVSSLLQLDAVSSPIIGKPGDFWIILAVEIVIAFGLFLYAKTKKWL